MRYFFSLSCQARLCNCTKTLDYGKLMTIVVAANTVKVKIMFVMPSLPAL